MKVRGWVYVLSNKAMPGLLKIGYSTKDPVLRIDELNGTGIPYPFDLEYDALVYEPRILERKIHAELAAAREAKEFFRVSVHTAIETIRAIKRADKDPIICEQCAALVPNSAMDASGAFERCRICGSRVSSHSARCSECFALLIASS